MPTRPVDHRWPVVTIVVGMLASVGACSGDSDPATAPSSAATASTTVVAGSSRDGQAPGSTSSTSVPPRPSTITQSLPPAGTDGAIVAVPAGGSSRIDLSVRHQTVDGFGISTRVWTDPHLSNASRTVVPPAVQDEILELLIDDLGVSRVRPIIEAGIEPVNDNADPDVLAPDGFSFDGKLTDEHVALVDQVRQRGVTVWFPAMLQPEPWMSEHTPEEFVERVMAQLLRWDAMGAVPPLVSPINEPSMPIAGGFSTPWLVEVVGTLGRRIAEAGLPTRIVIPDDLNPTTGLPKAIAVLEDPAARPYVAAIAYHLYGGEAADRQRLAELGERYDVPVWMTEFSRAEWDSWPAVLEWASTVDRLFTEDAVSAVDYLWGFFGSQDEGHSLVSITFEDGQYQSHTPTAAYWATGQWSRFVRPGFVRVDTATGPDGPELSAFVDPTGRELVIVAVNPRTDAVALPIEVDGGGLAGDIRAVRSSADERWAELAPPTQQEGSFAAELAAESITTFIVPIDS